MSFQPIQTGFLPPPSEIPPMPTPELQKEQTKSVPQESSFSGLDFRPATDAFPTSDEIEEVSEGDLFSLAETEFKKRVTVSPDGKPMPIPNAEKKSLGEIMPEGMIEISAEMYVEILEGAVAGVCQMFGDENGKYLFNKVYKSKYTEITKTFFKYQNVQITPAQLFVFCTIAIISGSGLKAYKDRRAKLAASKFQKKVASTTPPGQQASMFEMNENTDGIRRNYEIDESGYFVKDANNKYAKKGEREKCPDYLTSFIVQFKNQNKKWPGKKEIDTYLNFNA